VIAALLSNHLRKLCIRVAKSSSDEDQSPKFNYIYAGSTLNSIAAREGLRLGHSRTVRAVSTTSAPNSTFKDRHVGFSLFHWPARILFARRYHLPQAVSPWYAIGRAVQRQRLATRLALSEHAQSSSSQAYLYSGASGVAIATWS
jgi:hypothetical protein